MANDKRFIVKNGRSQNVEFTDSQDGSNQITLNMLNTDTLNFEGDAGSLFSISDDLTGTVFSVGDISGIPIIEVNGDTHNVTFNEFDGKVMIGGTDSGSTDSDVLNVTGNVRATAYYGDGSNLTGIAASGGVDSAAVSSIITADVDKAFVDTLNVDADTLDGVNSTSFLRSDALDTKTSGNLVFNDNVQANFGTSSDLKIFHNGTNAIIRDDASSQLYLQSDASVRITKDLNAENMAIFNADGAVELYYDNSKKFETVTGGVTITGTATATTFSGSGASLTSLPAGQLTGTVSDARLPSSISSDITGNAATATILSTARNIDITGVTATAQSFDGSGDISIPVTAVPASLLTGTISDARLPASISSDITGNAATADSATSAGSAVQAENADRLDNISSGSFLRSDAADTKTSGDLTFSDNVQANFGDGSDLQIYHNGSNSLIRDLGSGSLYLDGSNIFIRQNTSELAIAIRQNSSVDLHYDATKRFETTSTGVTVSGSLVTIEDTDSGATENPTLKLYRNSASPAASDNIGNIQFTGNNSSGTEVVLADIEAVLGGTTAGSEEGRMRLKVNDGGTEFTVIEIGYDRVQFNEGIFINYGKGITYEGSNFNDFETLLTATEPTQDNTITLPNATGTVLLTNGDGSSLTSVDAETLDGVNSTSFLRSDTSDNYTSGTLTFNSGTQLKLTSNSSIPVLDIDGGGPNFIRFTDNGSTTDAVNIVYRTTPNDLRIERSTNDNIIAEFGGDDGHAALFFNNSQKLTTVTGGVTVSGTATATTFSGSGASLTNLPAGQLTGALPAIDGSNLTGIDAGSSVTVSLDAPTSPSSGDLWYDAEFGNLLIYYDDSDTNQWVTTNAPSLADSSVSSNKFINPVSLTIYDSSGSSVKTLFSPDR